MPNPTSPSIPTPALPQHFDYTRAAHQANLSPADLAAIIHLFEHDYPHDLMLRELHILRACNAIIRGAVTLRDILAAPGEQAA